MNHESWIRSCVATLLVAACAPNHAAPSSSGNSKIRDASTPDVSAESGRAPELPPVISVDAKVPREHPDGSGICAGQVSQAEQIVLDMLIAMDGSGSMTDAVDGGARKWDLVVAAVDAFVSDPESAGIGAGLTYFGLREGPDAGEFVVSCNPLDYARPAVGIGVLPSNGVAIATSLSNYVPQGGTPTRPALEGIVRQAHAWEALHPTHRLIIVLATDGEPNDCGSTIASVAAIAKSAASEAPPIATYVIGVGASLSNLDQIARAGGTSSAYVVDARQNTTASFLAALNAIRGEAVLPCTYELPPASPGKPFDYERVNVDYTPGTTSVPAPLLQVPSRGACDPGLPLSGWHYDDPLAPTSIALCPSTCKTVQGDTAGSIQVRVGCKTEKRILK